MIELVWVITKVPVWCCCCSFGHKYWNSILLLSRTHNWVELVIVVVTVSYIVANWVLKKWCSGVEWSSICKFGVLWPIFFLQVNERILYTLVCMCIVEWLMNYDLMVDGRAGMPSSDAIDGMLIEERVFRLWFSAGLRISWLKSGWFFSGFGMLVNWLKTGWSLRGSWRCFYFCDFLTLFFVATTPMLVS